MFSRRDRWSSCSLLPIPSVIFCVRQDIQNEDSLRLVVYPGDQTVFIARDVEDGFSSKQIRNAYSAPRLACALFGWLRILEFGGAERLMSNGLGDAHLAAGDRAIERKVIDQAIGGGHQVCDFFRFVGW